MLSWTVGLAVTVAFVVGVGAIVAMSWITGTLTEDTSRDVGLEILDNCAVDDDDA